MIFEEFLAMARRETYAIPHGQRCEDGTEHMAFDLNPWRYRDRYMGQNPYGGQEMVWCGGGDANRLMSRIRQIISREDPSETSVSEKPAESERNREAEAGRNRLQTYHEMQQIAAHRHQQWYGAFEENP